MSIINNIAVVYLYKIRMLTIIILWHLVTMLYFSHCTRTLVSDKRIKKHADAGNLNSSMNNNSTCTFIFKNAS